MKQNKFQMLYTVSMLLRRDFLVIRKRLVDVVINNAIIFTCLYAIFSLFGSHMGISAAMVPVIFMGLIGGNLIYLGYTQALVDLFDIKTDRCIEYQLTLPIKIEWLLLRWICRYLMELMLVSIFSIIFIKFLLGSSFPLSNVNWFIFIFALFVSISFVATLFLFFTFATSFDWFRFNIWQRVLWPIVAFGGNFFSWYSLYEFSRPIAYLMLLNPYVYVSESIRVGALPGMKFLSPVISLSLLSVLIIIGFYVVRYYIRKKLDCI